MVRLHPRPPHEFLKFNAPDMCEFGGELGHVGLSEEPRFNYEPGADEGAGNPRETVQPPEPWQAVEETNREAAHDLRGENLTAREFSERAESIAVLRRAVLQWKTEHIPEGTVFDRRLLKQLTIFLSTEHAETINKITGHFLDRQKYPNRPVVKLVMRDIGSMPDVLLFGWRGEDQKSGETKIHDHGSSSVSVTVHQGGIREKIYPIDKKEWLTRKVGQAMKFLDLLNRRDGRGKPKHTPAPIFILWAAFRMRNCPYPCMPTGALMNKSHTIFASMAINLLKLESAETAALNWSFDT